MKPNKNIRFNKRRPTNSWQKVGKWYGKITEGEGHYYHKNLIIPKVLDLLDLNINSSVIEFGCGSGILGRSVGPNVKYLGIDLSETLIREAIKQDSSNFHKYKVGNAVDLNITTDKFSHAVFILSLQNMEDAERAIENAVSKLKDNSKLLLVINHPSFRIPRHSSWEIDVNTKLEYRKINRYMSDLKIPINMNPGDRNSKFTWSYHYPLTRIVKMITKHGLFIEDIDELVSNKQSEGKNSKMENLARNEFPLFMTILAVKNNN
jgi:ubiquinone/menaquinone biosynthesis C-methylase UbiE